MPKAYIALFFSYREQLELLSDEERGKLVLYLLNYAENGAIPQLEGMSKMAFAFIKAQIDRDSEKYEKRCEKNRENIQKRWNQEDTNVYDGIRTNTKHTKEKEKKKEKEKEKERVPPKSPTGDATDQTQESTESPGESLTVKMADGAGKKPASHSATPEDPRFSVFWSAYPRKDGRKTALKIFSKLRADDSLLETMLKSIERQKKSRQWQDKNFIPFGSTWLNQRRWEDEGGSESDESKPQYNFKN